MEIKTLTFCKKFALYKPEYSTQLNKFTVHVTFTKCYTLFGKSINPDKLKPADRDPHCFESTQSIQVNNENGYKYTNGSLTQSKICSVCS